MNRPAFWRWNKIVLMLSAGMLFATATCLTDPVLPLGATGRGTSVINVGLNVLAGLIGLSR